MNKHLKIVIFPIVVMVRIYRRIRMRPSFVAWRLFAYDRGRFVHHAGAFRPEARSASIARIIMAYHVLEKGITMPRRHLDFGHSAVLNLISLVEDFERRFGTAEPQLKHAIGCVKEYFSLHIVACFDFSKDDVYWDRIKAFCSRHEGVQPSHQKEMTREMFYEHNDAPFPIFAKARHTLRHYQGSVSVGQIKLAVELAMTAPSACNRQYVKVYCVSNHEIRDEIFCLQNGNRGFGTDADKLLVITSDLAGVRWPEERSDIFTNAGIFIMNLCYSLHYNKVAHCILNWSVSPENDRVARSKLHLPESETVVAIICCGNAPGSFLVASSPRKNVGDVFCEIS